MTRGASRLALSTSPHRAGAMKRAGSIFRASSTGSEGPRKTTVSRPSMSVRLRLAHAGNYHGGHRNAEFRSRVIDGDHPPEAGLAKKAKRHRKVVFEGAPKRWSSADIEIER